MRPFSLRYDAEGRHTAEFLRSWLPFLSDGLCNHCEQTISDRIRSLQAGEKFEVRTPLVIEKNRSTRHRCSYSSDSDTEAHSPCSFTANSRAKRSWADMFYADEYLSCSNFASINESSEDKWMNEVAKRAALSRDQREYIGFCNVRRKKDFVLMERVNGEFLNVVDGLELHRGVFSAEEQNRIVSYVERLEDMGRKGLLKERTYSAPWKWMRGKGRITLQFGCCYNYAMDKSGNPPGILRNEIVDPIPELFKSLIKRLVRWHVLPVSCVPDSCIVNIYEEGDCIPPHIDNHDFVRPFCTVSFLSECEILFGSNLKIVGAGEFSGSLAVPLPVGSVLVINGNGADVAKHCVPAVPTRRISITFRKMRQSKLPLGYVPEPDLIGLQPLSYDSVRSLKAQPSVTYATKRPSSSREAIVESKRPSSSREVMVGRDRIYKRRRLIPWHEDRFLFRR